MSWMVSKKNAVDSPFSALQAFLVETEATALVTDQEKADWIEAYVDQVDPIVLSSMYARGGSAPHPPARMFKLTIYQILKSKLRITPQNRQSKNIDSPTQKARRRDFH